MELADKKRYCQIVGQMLLVDAEISDEEHHFLEALMERLALGERDKEEVVEALDADTPVSATIAAMGAQARAGLLADVRAAANADGLLGPRELALLAEVEAALMDDAPAAP